MLLSRWWWGPLWCTTCNVVLTDGEDWVGVSADVTKSKGAPILRFEETSSLSSSAGPKDEYFFVGLAVKFRSATSKQLD